MDALLQQAGFIKRIDSMSYGIAQSERRYTAWRAPVVVLQTERERRCTAWHAWHAVWACCRWERHGTRAGAVAHKLKAMGMRFCPDLQATSRACACLPSFMVGTACQAAAPSVCKSHRKNTSPNSYLPALLPARSQPQATQPW